MKSVEECQTELARIELALSDLSITVDQRLALLDEQKLWNAHLESAKKGYVGVAESAVFSQNEKKKQNAADAENSERGWKELQDRKRIGEELRQEQPGLRRRGFNAEVERRFRQKDEKQ